MKTYENIQKLNKDLESLGMRINEKFEIWCKMPNGEEKKVGNLRHATPEEEKKTDLVEKVKKELKANRKQRKRERGLLTDPFLLTNFGSNFFRNFMIIC